MPQFGKTVTDKSQLTEALILTISDAIGVSRYGYKKKSDSRAFRLFLAEHSGEEPSLAFMDP
jgi:hypothetical protein